MPSGGGPEAMVVGLGMAVDRSSSWSEFLDKMGQDAGDRDERPGPAQFRSSAFGSIQGGGTAPRAAGSRLLAEERDWYRISGLAQDVGRLGLARVGDLRSSRWAVVRRLRRGGHSWRGSRLQDSRGSSTECWRMLSLQLVSGGRSSQCAPVGLSSARWNDCETARWFGDDPGAIGGGGRGSWND